MPALKHIHTYERDKVFKDHYRCRDPKCTSHAHKNTILGKVAICPFCTQEFVLDREQLLNAVPRCFNCSNSKRAIKIREAKEISKRILSSVDSQSPTGNPMRDELLLDFGPTTIPDVEKEAGPSVLDFLIEEKK